MNIVRKHLFILILAIPFCMAGQSPLPQKDQANKNALYLSCDWMTKNLSYAVNYERILFINGSRTFRMGSSLGLGSWHTVDSKGSIYNLNFHFLAGTGSFQGELITGIRCMNNGGHYFYPEPPEIPTESEQSELSFFPNFAVGFRYQKPGGHFLFKTAIGVPFLQLSLGYQF